MATQIIERWRLYFQRQTPTDKPALHVLPDVGVRPLREAQAVYDPSRKVIPISQARRVMAGTTPPARTGNRCWFDEDVQVRAGSVEWAEISLMRPVLRVAPPDRWDTGDRDSGDEQPPQGA